MPAARVYYVSERIDRFQDPSLPVKKDYAMTLGAFLFSTTQWIIILALVVIVVVLLIIKKKQQQE